MSGQDLSSLANVTSGQSGIFNEGNSLFAVMNSSISLIDLLSGSCVCRNTQILISGGNDGYIRLWDTNGEQILKILAHGKRVTQILSPIGSDIFFSCSDEILKAWNCISGQCTSQIQFDSSITTMTLFRGPPPPRIQTPIPQPASIASSEAGIKSGGEELNSINNANNDNINQQDDQQDDFIGQTLSEAISSKNNEQLKTQSKQNDIDEIKQCNIEVHEGQRGFRGAYYFSLCICTLQRMILVSCNLPLRLWFRAQAHVDQMISFCFDPFIFIPGIQEIRDRDNYDQEPDDYIETNNINSNDNYQTLQLPTKNIYETMKKSKKHSIEQNKQKDKELELVDDVFFNIGPKEVPRGLQEFGIQDHISGKSREEEINRIKSLKVDQQRGELEIGRLRRSTFMAPILLGMLFREGSLKVFLPGFSSALSYSLPAMFNSEDSGGLCVSMRSSKIFALSRTTYQIQAFSISHKPFRRDEIWTHERGNSLICMSSLSLPCPRPNVRSQTFKMWTKFFKFGANVSSFDDDEQEININIRKKQLMEKSLKSTDSKQKSFSLQNQSSLQGSIDKHQPPRSQITDPKIIRNPSLITNKSSQQNSLKKSLIESSQIPEDEKEEYEYYIPGQTNNKSAADQTQKNEDMILCGSIDGKIILFSSLTGELYASWLANSEKRLSLVEYNPLLSLRRPFPFGKMKAFEEQKEATNKEQLNSKRKQNIQSSQKQKNENLEDQRNDDDDSSNIEIDLDNLDKNYELYGNYYDDREKTKEKQLAARTARQMKLAQIKEQDENTKSPYEIEQVMRNRDLGSIITVCENGNVKIWDANSLILLCSANPLKMFPRSIHPTAMAIIAPIVALTFSSGDVAIFYAFGFLEQKENNDNKQNINSEQEQQTQVEELDKEDEE
ncbi:MAG: hypothetical protein EZS28_026362, partial [Streblomastix strix]